MRELWTMTRYDLRQRIRDKSVIIFAILVPLALMFVLELVLGDLTNPELQPTTVAASVPADDQLGAALVQVIRSLDGVGAPDPERVHVRVRKGLRPGAIVLLHDASERDTYVPASVEALPRILDAITERGLRTVKVEEFVEADAARS